MNHGVKIYHVALNCITADKLEMDAFQSTMVLNGAALLTGDAVSNVFFFMTIHTSQFNLKNNARRINSNRQGQFLSFYSFIMLPSILLINTASIRM